MLLTKPSDPSSKVLLDKVSSRLRSFQTGRERILPMIVCLCWGSCQRNWIKVLGGGAGGGPELIQ